MALITVLRSTRGSGRCRSCGAPITWYQTTGTGKAMPFDADPPVDHTESMAVVGLVDYIDAAHTHFRTCPQAAEHRKPRPKTGDLFGG